MSMQSASNDHLLVQKVNTSLILNALRTYDRMSCQHLAEQLGLTTDEAQGILDELIESQFIRPNEDKPDRYELSPDGGCAIGVEFAVEWLRIIMTDFVANVIWEATVPREIEEPEAKSIARAEELIDQALKIAEDKGLRPLGIGIGVPGLVDVKNGVLEFAPNVQWSDIPFRRIWQTRFNMPVHLENNANAAAFGEFYFGIAQRADHLIYLSAGFGLGGSVILDGKIFRGSHGYAGEIGHMVMNPAGERCGCGRRGCWETLVGPQIVERLARERIESGEPSILTEMRESPDDPITFNMVLEAAGKRDAVARDAFRNVGRHLGHGVVGLVNIFNPQLVVLGGVLSSAAEYLIPVAEEIIHEVDLVDSNRAVRLVASAYGTDACATGGVALVLDAVLEDPSILEIDHAPA
jgi:glucokinase-like ROK family protein